MVQNSQESRCEYTGPLARPFAGSLTHVVTYYRASGNVNDSILGHHAVLNHSVGVVLVSILSVCLSQILSDCPDLSLYLFRCDYTSL